MKRRSATLFLILVISAFWYLGHTQTSQSANLTVVKNTLQSSRLSFAGRVSTPTTDGSSQVWLYSTGGACGTTSCYSTSTAGLKVGDVLQIGGSNNYTVNSIIDESQFSLTSNLAVGDADDTDTIFMMAKPRHVITFNTATAIANGFFRILIPASTANFNDGRPDVTGFDFAGGTIDVSATNTTGYTFTTPVSTVSGGTNCPSGYHCFSYHYSGSGGINTPITLTIGNTNGSNSLIAPAPTSSHDLGVADTYNFIVQNFAAGANPGTDSPIDQSTGKIGLIESVRVTATVDPSISFSITGVASSTTACGVTTNVNTQTAVNAPLAVPFGVLSLNTFKTAAHNLLVSTNASNGYAVTVVQNDQLGKDGATSPFIIDTTCDTGLCSETVQATWVTATNSGFGYSLESVSGATVPFSHGGIFNTRQFPALSETEAPATIMSGSSIANNHLARICYRISVDATQAAGDYENQITYTATASF
jgi:hypothetical protein